MATPDPVIKKYFDLIQANTGAFKAYYYGDPVRIPASNLPAICGSRRMTTTTWATNAEDEHNMQLVFTIVTDIRKDFSDDVTSVPGWDTIFDIMEGRDPTTLLLKPQSLLNIIREGFAIGNSMWTDVRTPTKVDYGLVANKRQAGSWSIEAALTTACTLVQLR